jgi:hypothetical protein
LRLAVMRAGGGRLTHTKNTIWRSAKYQLSGD